MRSSYEALVDIFECVENFLRRLKAYTDIPATPAMTEILIKIMAELLSVLALATKQINQGRLSESHLSQESPSAEVPAEQYAKKFLGERSIELVLQRLDRLTVEESRATVVQTLDVVYGLVNNMEVVMEGPYRL